MKHWWLVVALAVAGCDDGGDGGGGGGGAGGGAGDAADAAGGGGGCPRTRACLRRWSPKATATRSIPRPARSPWPSNRYLASIPPARRASRCGSRPPRCPATTAISMRIRHLTSASTATGPAPRSRRCSRGST
ncbi:MAG: hypothetical protein R3F43_10380 [bacterium]